MEDQPETLILGMPTEVWIGGLEGRGGKGRGKARRPQGGDARTFDIEFRLTLKPQARIRERTEPNKTFLVGLAP